jgi:hypothetical protein
MNQEVIAGLIVGGAVCWLVVRFIRKREGKGKGKKDCC